MRRPAASGIFRAARFPGKQRACASTASPCSRITGSTGGTITRRRPSTGRSSNPHASVKRHEALRIGIIERDGSIIQAGRGERSVEGFVHCQRSLRAVVIGKARRQSRENGYRYGKRSLCRISPAEERRANSALGGEGGGGGSLDGDQGAGRSSRPGNGERLASIHRRDRIVIPLKRAGEVNRLRETAHIGAPGNRECIRSALQLRAVANQARRTRRARNEAEDIDALGERKQIVRANRRGHRYSTRIQRADPRRRVPGKLDDGAATRLRKRDAIQY